MQIRSVPDYDHYHETTGFQRRRSESNFLIESKGLQVHLSEGSQVTIVGVVGDKTKLAGSNIEMSEGVDKVVAVTESYKLVNKNSTLMTLLFLLVIPILGREP